MQLWVCELVCDMDVDAECIQISEKSCYSAL